MARKSLVLVIHQNKRIRDEIAESLIQADYRVCHASGKRDGIPILYQSHPDAVVLELDDVKGESWSILSRIRIFAADTPVVFVSESVNRIDRERGRTEKVYDFVDLSAQGQGFASIPKCLDRLQLARGGVSASDTVRLEPAVAPSDPGRSMSVSEWRQVDHALEDVGESGEVRLVKHKGRLAFIVCIRTRRHEPMPA